MPLHKFYTNPNLANNEIKFSSINHTVCYYCMLYFAIRHPYIKSTDKQRVLCIESPDWCRARCFPTAVTGDCIQFIQKMNNETCLSAVQMRWEWKRDCEIGNEFSTFCNSSYKVVMGNGKSVHFITWIVSRFFVKGTFLPP